KRDWSSDVCSSDLIHAGVETKRCHNCRLGGCIVAFNIGGWVSFCITQASSFCQCVVVSCTGRLHRIQNEVGGAINDARNALDVIASQGTTQHTHDRNGGRNSSLVVKFHTRSICCFC